MVVDKAHTVERFNRTLKETIQTRLDAMDLSRDKWIFVIYNEQFRVDPWVADGRHA